MQRIVAGLMLGWLLLQAAVFGEEKGDAGAALHAARTLLLTGKYSEAQGVYRNLLADHPVAAAVGLSRCQNSVGQRDKAIKSLRSAIKTNPKAAALHAELARRLFERGEFEHAAKEVGEALKHDFDSPLARWIQAELFRATGKLKEAAAAHEWFVDFYNQHQAKIKDPDDFRWIALGAAQFARWSRNSELFNDIVNTLLPDALALEKNYWPAHYEAGLLFLEKYNRGEATRKLNAALAVNPAAAEAHAAKAQLALQSYQLDSARTSIRRALETNPDLIRARQLQGDLHLANFEHEKALKELHAALKLHPADEETLGRIAAVHVLRHGLPKEEEFENSPLGKIIQELNARNPHAGAFYFTLAQRLSDRRKFPYAERFFRQAIERMPQLVGPRGQLGLMYMRMGREVEAKKLLDESFKIDPFNVRVANMLEVLDVLATYASIETEHFIVKFDRGQDAVLARYVAKYLEEEVYPELCKQFGFEPKGKTLFEIFNRAKNSSGHSWFSARMVGLPYIGTVGACAGKMVGLASPAGMDEPYNWARVVKHEFVHVLNLQQTNFNIPHWYTEALAVLNENYPRPAMWNKLLAARVPKGEVFNLDDINLGFIRPSSDDDWHMAYCQAELYAQYMLERHGKDALAKMLEAYGDNLTTDEALKRCFDVEKAAFEKGYLAYVKKIVAGLSPGKKAETEMGFADLQLAVRKDPENPDLLAKLAYALLQRKQYARARRTAENSLKKKDKHPLATYVMARIRLLIGENEAAAKLLEEALDGKNPHERLLTLLAALKLRAKDVAGAEKLYELGRRAHPGDNKWLKALAGVYLKSGQKEKLAGVLKELTALEFDNVLYRKKLAQLALEQKDYAAVRKWANQANDINVMDNEVHRLLAQANTELGRLPAAIEEYEVIIQLTPGDTAARLALAKACVRNKQVKKARRALEKLLEIEAENAEAKKLLEQLDGNDE